MSCIAQGMMHVDALAGVLAAQSKCGLSFSAITAEIAREVQRAAMPSNSTEYRKRRADAGDLTEQLDHISAQPIKRVLQDCAAAQDAHQRQLQQLQQLQIQVKQQQQQLQLQQQQLHHSQRKNDELLNVIKALNGCKDTAGQAPAAGSARMHSTTPSTSTSSDHDIIPLAAAAFNCTHPVSPRRTAVQQVQAKRVSAVRKRAAAAAVAAAAKACFNSSTAINALPAAAPAALGPTELPAKTAAAATAAGAGMGAAAAPRAGIAAAAAAGAGIAAAAPTRQQQLLARLEDANNEELCKVIEEAMLSSSAAAQQQQQCQPIQCIGSFSAFVQQLQQQQPAHVPISACVASAAATAAALQPTPAGHQQQQQQDASSTAAGPTNAAPTGFGSYAQLQQGTPQAPAYTAGSNPMLMAGTAAAAAAHCYTATQQQQQQQQQALPQAATSQALSPDSALDWSCFGSHHSSSSSAGGVQLDLSEMHAADLIRIPSCGDLLALLEGFDDGGAV